MAINPLTVEIGTRRVEVAPPGPHVVGRDLAAAVSIDAGLVSRHHLLLTSDEHGWTVRDTSRNSTFVDGERLSPSKPRVVGPNSQLRLGDHDVDVVQDVVRNASEPSEPRPAQATEG